MTITVWVIVCYLLVQFGIGIWASRRIATEDDYLVAGRRLGYPLGIFSIFATWFGAETCIGAAGDIHANGLSWTTAEPFGYGLCIILMGAIFAAPLWHRKLTTIADLFRQRYSIGVERAAAIFLIPTSIFWAAAQIRAFGHVLASTTTLSVGLAITAAAGIAILYTAIGGLLADAVTDLVQGAALTIGLLVVFVAAVLHFGGPAGALDAVEGLTSTATTPAAAGSPLATLEAWLVPVIGSVVAAELVSRVIAARSPTVAYRSALAAGGLYITVGLIPVFVGLTGASIVPDVTESEQLLPAVASALLPSAFYAVFAGALISAILSTVDSTLLIASGLLSHNLVIPLMSSVSEGQKLLFARIGVGLFGIVAFFLALTSTGVLDLVVQASAFGSAGSVTVVCFGLFTKLGGARTALATLFTGMGVYLAGLVAGSSYPFVTSLGASLVVYVLVGAWEWQQAGNSGLTRA